MRWQETVPNDPYLIRVRRPISNVELSYLIHLYQPLVGALPVALYQTLLYNLSLANFSAVQGLHYRLMVTMAVPLNVIVKARHQLEAIGLLEVYQIEADGQRIFEYILQPPHSPDIFFSDDTLSIMLLNRVGKEFYRKLRRQFSIPEEYRLPENVERKRITKAFDEVFYHLSLSEITVEKGTETYNFLKDVREESPLPLFDPMAATRLNYANSRLDFEFLEASLPKMIKKDGLFTKEVKAELESLAFLYGIDNETMARFLQEPSVIEYDTIDTASLRRLVKDWFRRENGRAPKIVSREEIVFHSDTVETERKEREEKALTEAESHALRLSSLSPFQLIGLYQRGAKIAPADQKIVEELLEEYQLPPGVVNVLLEYVMMTYDRQLPKDIIYKIAGHWKRNNIRTVQEAQRQARQFYSERKSAKAASADKKVFTRASSGGRSKRRKDEIPPLILEQLERQKNQVTEEKTAKSSKVEMIDEEYERKRKRMEELLKALGESKQ
ncbi:replication initiation and membrane attachment family protein [Aneurinibacillus thermoaerophilus]|uniref:DnaD domain protein n=1 Tax=Aneurinibacillus thermoaerophilus TaxID=143495 RepID=A0A1G7WUJ6_ANETH|nr:DnaD domain protein [Aneurinibacillus thermoaerophilus]MED0676203.1 DnaD domain protein [Aneurinibacillus thermoaerophilus]MED0678135.1 DnaD domain protein [Aneurinibacillus thermoaerophilus]MED0737679.1 DnaD domain protein [Aneurinibacillus thermoaerophilus]MED0755671.1 DnaD domain protein [Aneurinibacillus thermoaerophilus]MED0760000.1 DnaD domain protein [Aneurinibacillus thermoaerophilus]